jgi:hypothetical protein
MSNREAKLIVCLFPPDDRYGARRMTGATLTMCRMAPDFQVNEG